MPIHAFFGRGEVGAHSPKWCHSSSQPQQDHPWAEPRHLSHKPRKSVPAGRWCEKKRTGQDRKKVTKGLYFTNLWRRPHWTDVNENLFSGLCSRHNHVCQVSKWNFQGLRFYRGSNFPFFLLILNGPYNSAALLPCLWSTCNWYSGPQWPPCAHSGPAWWLLWTFVAIVDYPCQQWLVNIFVGLSLDFYQRSCQKHNCRIVHVTLYNMFQIWRPYHFRQHIKKEKIYPYKFCFNSVCPLRTTVL